MKQKVKKLVQMLAIVAILSTPLTVFAASYSTTYSFLVSVEGSARSFSSGTIRVSLNSTETKNGSVSGLKTFSVSLYKKNLIFKTYIGKFSAVRNGRTTNGWTNMAKGKYLLYLSKANDGARVQGSASLTQ